MKLPFVLEAVRRLGHVVFEAGDYNLNLIGIRAAIGVPDAFDDLMCVVYKAGDQWVTRTWNITTDPGLYYLMSKSRQLNPLGTAALVPGQYRSTWQLGLHGGRYEALVQRKPVRVYRDSNHDRQLDLDPPTVQSGLFGINIHASDSTPYTGDRTRDKVGAWSAGCQVFQRERDFRAFMELCKNQIRHHPSWPETFTYTLVNEADLYAGA